MRIAIISDIHANLEALEASLEKLSEENIDLFVSLGDIVGYGVDPNKCAEIVREKFQVSLLGNHDFAALGRLDISYFNPYAKNSVKWTEEKLTEVNKEYLENLKMFHKEDNLYYVHSTPCKPEDWNYIFTIHDARVNFECFEEKVCFIGHSHQPVFIMKNQKNEIFVKNESELQIEDEFRYIINVGSIGQPRDGNPKSSFAVYDTDERLIILHRITYDIEKTQKKMVEAKIHPFLVDRIANGR